MNGPNQEMLDQQSLDILRTYWTRYTYEHLLPTWMNKDKQHFTVAECNVINDTFVEGFNILETLTLENAAQMSVYFRKMNTICELMNK
jgi:hypothetical protein